MAIPKQRSTPAKGGAPVEVARGFPTVASAVRLASTKAEEGVAVADGSMIPVAVAAAAA